ncbi:MAG: glycoside hydrolase family 13 protein, partial [Paraclostridium sp.]
KDPDNRRTYPWKNEDKELMNFYKKMTKERNNIKSLSSGDTIFLNLNNDDVFGYIRYTENVEDSDVLNIVNRSKDSVILSIDLLDIYKIASSYDEEYKIIDNKININLDPKSFKNIILSK